jgi:hypothetical protein
MKKISKPARIDEAPADLPLATKFASAYARLIEFHQIVADADLKRDIKRTARAKPAELAKKLAVAPSDQITWHDLALHARNEPDSWQDVWNRIRDEAAVEVTSGHRAASVVATGCEHGPLERARFLRAREDLRREWDPAPGSESMLIDMLAQIQAVWEIWLARHICPLQQETIAITESGLEVHRRLGDSTRDFMDTFAGSPELTAEMVDRFNRVYLRTLRALRDLRRMAPQVLVQHAGQVNVGEKQVNVSETIQTQPTDCTNELVRPSDALPEVTR